MKVKQLSILILTIALTACVSTSTSVESHKQKGKTAEKKGNWHAARKHYAEALVMAQLKQFPDSALASINHDYGRALGATCFYDESETNLLQSYMINKKAGQATQKDLIELARLNLSQQRYAQSATYFKTALPLLKKTNTQQDTPMEYANILSQYSSALTQSGHEVEAEKYQQQSFEIQSSNKAAQSISPNTPYGQHCAKS